MGNVVGRRSLPFRGDVLPVIEKGQGGAIGYLHGALGHPGVPELIDLLSARGQVVAPNLPGFFGAPANDQLRNLHDWVAALSEVVDAAGLAGRPMIASSVTAMLALELAAIRPEAFSHLFLIAPLGLWDTDRPVADLFARVAGREVELLVADPAHLEPIFGQATGAADQVERSVSRYIARTTCASLIWPLPEFGLIDRIHRVSCPVTLIWGEQDRFIPSSYADRFRAILPNIQDVHIVPGAGHQVDLDRPEIVAAVVEAALAAARPRAVAEVGA